MKQEEYDFQKIGIKLTKYNDTDTDLYKIEFDLLQVYKKWPILLHTAIKSVFLRY
jgi:hypothetical protein